MAVTVFLSTSLFDKDGTTLLANMATAYNRQWLEERDGEGSFSLAVPYEDSAALTTGRIVKFSWGSTSDAWVFAGIIEAITVSKTGGNTQGEDRVAEISGRGVRCLLDNALVYPASGNATRTFTGKTAGEIMRTFITEAHARGAMLELSADFTNTTDSNGQAFSKTLTLSEGAGTTLAEIATRHQELAVDVNVTADMEVQYFNNRGTDHTVAVPTVALRVGQSIGELTTERAGPVKNTVLVGYGTNTYTTRSNTGSVSTYGRRETFLNLSNTNSASHAQLAGDQVLSISALPSDGITLQLDPTGPQPYSDFNIGDYLWVVDHIGARTKYRVSSISVSEAEDGSITFVPELGTLRADLTRRLNRALARLEAKNANGNQTTDLTPGTGTSGQIVVLPGGVILPATINTGAGFPFSRETLNDSAALPYSFMLQNLPWTLLDLSSIGFYTRTLVTGSWKATGTSTGTAFLNMDNLAYGSFAPSSTTGGDHPNAFKLINGELYFFGASIQKYSGSAWVDILTGVVTRPYQVGTTWFVFRTDATLWQFDETTGLTTQIAAAPTGPLGQPVFATIGNGYVWACLAQSGSSNRFFYVRPTTVAGSWTNVMNFGAAARKSAAVGLDGDLIVYAGPSSGTTGTGVLYRVNQDGTYTSTSGVASYLDTLRAAGKYIYAHADSTYVSGTNRLNSLVNYKEQGGYLGANASEWVLVTTVYGDTPNRGASVKWRIDAVGPQGYAPVVPETTTPIPVSSGLGAEAFTWAPNGAEDTLRVSVNDFIYEYAVTLDLP